MAGQRRGTGFEGRAVVLATRLRCDCAKKHDHMTKGNSSSFFLFSSFAEGERQLGATAQQADIDMVVMGHVLLTPCIAVLHQCRHVRRVVARHGWVISCSRALRWLQA